MNRTAATRQQERSDQRCLSRSVVATLAEEPALEAVTIDRAHQKISVATLGRTDVAALTGRLTEKLREAQTAGSVPACGLLSGEGDYTTCDQPLTPEELKRITIRQEGDATTIARVTC